MNKDVDARIAKINHFSLRTMMIVPVNERVLEFIRAHGLTQPGGRILLSVSAGKDSMALLDIMLSLRERLDISIGLFHLNHGVRGSESDEDEHLVMDRARAHGLEAYVARMQAAPGKGESFEDYARACRYREAERISRAHGYTRVATAHTLDDQAETILMRIFYGTGVHGLAGIAPRRGAVIRPLLGLSSAEIYAHLEERTLTWREDDTNRETVYFRNFVRHEILGRVRERLPSVSRAIRGLGELARENELLLQGLITEKYGNVSVRDREASLIHHARFIKDESLLKWVLAGVIRNDFGEFVHGGMLAEICRNLKVRRTHANLYIGPSISVVKTVVHGEPVIRIERREDRKEGAPPWEYRVDIREHRVTAAIEEIRTTFLVEHADLERFYSMRSDGAVIFIAVPGEIGYISIRNRRAGDRIMTESGHKKVKDLYIENKLDTARKNDIPLIVAGGEVAAVMLGVVPGLRSRISTEFFVRADSKRILALSAMN